MLSTVWLALQQPCRVPERLIRTDVLAAALLALSPAQGHAMPYGVAGAFAGFPEPSILFLLGAGCVLLSAALRRHTRKGSRAALRREHRAS
jgi:hypothetical protein